MERSGSPGHTSWVGPYVYIHAMYIHASTQSSKKNKKYVMTGSHFLLLMKTLFGWRRGSGANVSGRALQNGVILPKRQIANLEKSVLNQKASKCARTGNNTAMPAKQPPEPA